MKISDRVGSVLLGNKSSYGFGLLCLTLFLLPFPRFLPYWSLSLFLLAGIFEWKKRHKELLPEFKKDLYFTAGPLLFFLLVIIWAVIQKPPLKSFSDSFLYLLVPVLGYPFFMSPEFSRKLPVVIKWFIAGLFIICLHDFLRATVNSFYMEGGRLAFSPAVDHETAASTTDYLSSLSRYRSFGLVSFSHPYYLAFKVLFALFLLVRFRESLKIRPLWIVIIFIILSIYLYAVSSRSSFIAAALILIFYLYRFAMEKKKLWQFFVLAPVVLVLFFSVSMSNPRIRGKTSFFIEQFKSKPENIEDSDPRLLAWITSAELIREYPLTGLGLASRDSLYARYIRSGDSHSAQLKINPHSQFLESQLSFGIPGTVVLLWMLFAPLAGRRRGVNSELYSVFLIIIITGSLFASLLLNNWGALFFVPFYCIIVFKRKSQEDVPANVKDAPVSR